MFDLRVVPVQMATGYTRTRDACVRVCQRPDRASEAVSVYYNAQDDCVYSIASEAVCLMHVCAARFPIFVVCAVVSH